MDEINLQIPNLEIPIGPINQEPLETEQQQQQETNVETKWKYCNKYCLAICLFVVIVVVVFIVAAIAAEYLVYLLTGIGFFVLGGYFVKYLYNRFN